GASVPLVDRFLPGFAGAASWRDRGRALPRFQPRPRRCDGRGRAGEGMSVPLLSMMIRYEHDVVGARQRARHIAETLGFDPIEQTRLATAVSEIGRNAFAYA